MATVESLAADIAAMQADTVATKSDIQQEIAAMKAAMSQVQAQQVQEVQAAAVVTKAIRDSGDALTAEVSAVAHRLAQLEQQGVGSSASAQDSKKKWGLTRPKDMEPEKFEGKDEAWLQWKEATEDYVDAVRPGLKHAMEVAAKVGGQIKDRSQLSSVTDEEWNLNSELFVLLKRKTTGEAKTLVTSALRDNGFESWRILVSRFEPQVGIKRMKEICDLIALQNKR